MAVRDVLTVPDARLKQVCTPVLDVDVERLARDLVDTMRASPGCVGIAAPQIGELVRMVVVDVTGHRRAVSCHGPLVLIDPEVIEIADERVTMREGCLSIPDLTGNVRRPVDVLVEATTLMGRERFACDAWECRVLLHELDHLDGILFLDRVASAADVFPRRH